MWRETENGVQATETIAELKQGEKVFDDSVIAQGQGSWILITLLVPVETENWRSGMIGWSAPSKWCEHPESAKRSANLGSSLH